MHERTHTYIGAPLFIQTKPHLLPPPAFLSNLDPFPVPVHDAVRPSPLLLDGDQNEGVWLVPDEHHRHVVFVHANAPAAATDAHCGLGGHGGSGRAESHSVVSASPKTGAPKPARSARVENTFGACVPDPVQYGLIVREEDGAFIVSRGGGHGGGRQGQQQVGEEEGGDWGLGEYHDAITTTRSCDGEVL